MNNLFGSYKNSCDMAMGAGCCMKNDNNGVNFYNALENARPSDTSRQTVK
jgi:hypothetical protein